jgi:hypothetical protein
MRRSRFSSVSVSLTSMLCLVACGAPSAAPGGLSGGVGGSGSGGPGGGSSAGGSGGTTSSTGSGVSSGSGGAYPPGSAPATPYSGANGSGQNNLITTGISPQSCGATSAFNGTTVMVVGGDNLTCYFSAAVSATTPLAFVEQDEEQIGGKDLIHVRLTLNPAFVDNTYGSTAIGWSGADAGATGGPMGATGAMMGPGPDGHSFWDLIDSDHAEFDFKDSSGDIVVSFDEDYASSDLNAPSGFACLGVAGGDGAMLVGPASDVVYYDSSLSRDLNACGYGSFTTNSPATDAEYTPNPATPNWDYRVVYDVWILKSVLPNGWTVSIPYVHASPSKMASTYTVTAAPCPPLGCVGEGCTHGGGCAGASCDAGTSTGCVGELCNEGGTTLGDDGGSWCSPQGAVCTDDSACCSSQCVDGFCALSQ